MENAKDITEIIVAIIGFLGVIAAQLIISNRSSKDLFNKLDKQSELTAYDRKELEKLLKSVKM